MSSHAKWATAKVKSVGCTEGGERWGGGTGGHNLVGCLPSLQEAVGQSLALCKTGHTPPIPLLWRWGKEDQEFMASLDT